MSKRKLLPLIMVLCILTSACAAGLAEDGMNTAVAPPVAVPTWPVATRQDLLAWANEIHRAVIKPQIRLENYTPTPTAPEYKLTTYMRQRPFRPTENLSPQQIERDLAVLFGLLSDRYGGYAYFGGEEAFAKAQAGVMHACLAAPQATGQVLLEALRQWLSFITDGHFLINDAALHPSIMPYTYTELEFFPTEKGFATVDGREVASIAGYRDWRALFRLSISAQGNLVYYPLVLAEQSPGPLTVRYRDGGTQTLAPTEPGAGQPDNAEAVGSYYHEGVPVIFARNFGFDQAYGDTIGGEFLAYAEKFQDAPVLIMDLRKNGGGNSVLPFKWLQSYTGQRVPTNCQGVYYMSEGEMIKAVGNSRDRTYTPYAELADMWNLKPLGEHHMSMLTQADAFIEHEPLLIVLTGKDTASAAELFVDAAHNLQNTLVVGQNTAGCLTGGSFARIYLPHSGISVYFGGFANLFPEGYFQEFVGFQPDLWVAGDACEAVIRLLENLE